MAPIAVPSPICSTAKQHGRHDRRLPELQLCEQRGAGRHPKQDREGHADAEQPAGQAGVGAERARVDARRVREQQNRQRQLGDVEGGAVRRVQLDQAEHIRPGDDARGDEHHRRGDRAQLEPPRDERVCQEHRRKDGEPGHGGPLPRDRLAVAVDVVLVVVADREQALAHPVRHWRAIATRTGSSSAIRWASSAAASSMSS
jgi:hypothetical protein